MVGKKPIPILSQTDSVGQPVDWLKWVSTDKG
jgi:hypothetical protein